MAQITRPQVLSIPFVVVRLTLAIRNRKRSTTGVAPHRAWCWARRGGASGCGVRPRARGRCAAAGC
ncbi:hypothetical protein HBB16_06675 [Pseudonocardia sp. MCCB 268]|nr:hypothetical protein [Pseudonocardia cytotoxica]